MIELEGKNITVWFSCGAASAVAAKMTIDLYGKKNNIRVVNNPVIEEHFDNKRFLKDVEAWIGVNIEYAINSKFPNCSVVEVWEKKKFFSGPKGASCTLAIKKEARYEWEKSNHSDWHVLGFTADEKHRHQNFVKTERDNVLPVLIDSNLKKSDCFNILKSAGIALPGSYVLGLPNANCLGCCKATSPTYWNHIRKIAPDVFLSRAEQSRRIGARLVRVKNKRIFQDELDPLATGRSMKSMNFECGIFCEEKI